MHPPFPNSIGVSISFIRRIKNKREREKNIYFVFIDWEISLIWVVIETLIEHFLFKLVCVLQLNKDFIGNYQRIFYFENCLILRETRLIIFLYFSHWVVISFENKTNPSKKVTFAGWIRSQDFKE